MYLQKIIVSLEIADPHEFEDPNCIKVVCDLRNNALYFSREPIPTRYKNNKAPMGKQVCAFFSKETI